MKRLLILICALGIAAATPAAPRTDDMRQALSDVRTAIDDAERQALESQSLEELNAAAREQVVRELKLTREQRKKFDPLYDAYRRALAQAIAAEKVDDPAADEATQRRRLKAKLENISATAQVKRDYVDRFAEVLTAEQIRRLYNAEGQIATSIKRATTYKSHSREVIRIKGKGNQATQDWGAAGDYKGIVADSYFHVTVSPTARTISVTTDERLIDHIALDRTDGVLRFRRNVGIRAENADLTVKVTVPLSAALRSLSAGSYGRIECPTPLKGESVSVEVSSYGRVSADLTATGKATLKINSYGKFEGSVRCDACDFSLSSYGTASCPIVCRTQCNARIGSYAKFSETIDAPQIDAQIASGAAVGSALKCDVLKLGVASYAKYTGNIDCREARVSISSGASVDSRIDASQSLDISLSSYAKFSGAVRSGRSALTIQSGASFDADFRSDSFEATAGSYGKIRLNGEAVVAKGSVKLSSGSSFSAPSLRVKEYRISAQNYSKSNVWCSGELHVDAATTAQVTYDGPCRVEATPSNVRRK